MDICLERNGIHVDIEVDEQGRVVLWNCSDQPHPRNGTKEFHPLVEVQGAGFNHFSHHGCKHVQTSPATELRYESHHMERNEDGELFSLTQQTDGLRVTTRWQFYDGVKALRADTLIENTGDRELPLQYVSSFSLTGLGRGENPRDNSYRMGIPHNA